MYGGFDAVKDAKAWKVDTKNVLDKWILARLKETITQVTKATDNYELDRATRPINDFVDDISTWYLRRSRDRFKSEDPDDRYSAMLTTRYVIFELSKLLAPSMPFLAEDLYLKITGGMKKESVHLEDWSDDSVGDLSKEETEIIENMKETRQIVSVGLEARAKVGIKVRQPLQAIKVKSPKLKDSKEYFVLILDEINVKEIIFDESNANEVELDINITEELKEEGVVRDIIRTIQGMRKDKNLNPQDEADLVVDTDSSGKKILEKFNDEISKVTGLKEISFESINGGELIELDSFKARMIIE